MAEKRPGYIPQPHHPSRLSAFVMGSIYLMLLSVILAQTSTTKCFRTFMPTFLIRWSSTSLLKLSMWKLLRMASESFQTRESSYQKSVSSVLAAAEASGWRPSAMTWRSPPSPTGWTSACAWSCPR